MYAAFDPAQFGGLGVVGALGFVVVRILLAANRQQESTRAADQQEISHLRKENQELRQEVGLVQAEAREADLRCTERLRRLEEKHDREVRELKRSAFGRGAPPGPD